MRSFKWQVLVAAALLMSAAGRADEPNARVASWEVEAGVLQTMNMEISGYRQGNATEDWESTDPTFRLEYWWKQEQAWNFGLALQPLYASYEDTIQNDLTAKGQVFRAGDDATLDYQFHTLRFTANYPLLRSADGSYLRLGGSVVARYADIDLKSATASINDTNFLVVPLLNVESDLRLSAKHSLFFRADFLPGIDGDLLRDGLYDTLLAYRMKLERSRKVDFGVRLFFGGYDPHKADDYANRIFYAGLVGRYEF